MSFLQFWLQFKRNRLTVLQKVPSVVGTCKHPLNIINFQVGLVLAAMQKNWSFVCEKLVPFHIGLLVKLVSLVEVCTIVDCRSIAKDLGYCNMCPELVQIIIC